MSPRFLAFLFVNVSCLCWAGNLVAGRLLRDVIGPGLLVSLRTVLAAVILLVVVRVVARAQPQADPPRQWGLLLLMAATGIVGYQGLLYQGLHTTGALNAALINALGPLITALMAWAVHGTRLAAQEYLGIGISMAGVAVILSGGDWHQLTHLAFGTGDALILCAVVLWGIFSLAGRKVMQTRSVISATALATALAVPLSLPWALIEAVDDGIRWSPQLAAGLLYVAVFASVVAMLAWNRAVRLAGPAQAAASMNMMPLYAVLVSTFVLREPLNGYQVGGGLLIIAGCLLAALVPPRRTQAPPAVAAHAASSARP